MSLTLKSPQDVASAISQRFKKRRLALNLSRSGLAERSGVNSSSLRRFENTGLISLESLLKLALVLNALDDFDHLAAADGQATESRSLDEILASSRPRNRGRLK